MFFFLLVFFHAIVPLVHRFVAWKPRIHWHSIPMAIESPTSSWSSTRSGDSAAPSKEKRIMGYRRYSCWTGLPLSYLYFSAITTFTDITRYGAAKLHLLQQNFPTITRYSAAMINLISLTLKTPS